MPRSQISSSKHQTPRHHSQSKDSSVTERIPFDIEEVSSWKIEKVVKVLQAHRRNRNRGKGDVEQVELYEDYIINYVNSLLKFHEEELKILQDKHTQEIFLHDEEHNLEVSLLTQRISDQDSLIQELELKLQTYNTPQALPSTELEFLDNNNQNITDLKSQVLPNSSSSSSNTENKQVQHLPSFHNKSFVLSPSTPSSKDLAALLKQKKQNKTSSKAFLSTVPPFEESQAQGLTIPAIIQILDILYCTHEQHPTAEARLYAQHLISRWESNTELHTEEINKLKEKILTLTTTLNNIYSNFQASSDSRSPNLTRNPIIEKLTESLQQLEKSQEAFLKNIQDHIQSDNMSPNPLNSFPLLPESRPSYADKLVNKPVSMKELPTMIIEPNNEDVTLSQLRQELYKLPPSSINIKQCTQTMTGKLIIRCEDEISLQKLKDKIQEIETIKEKASITIPERRGKRAIIFSIPNSVTSEELEKVIRNRLPEITLFKFIKTLDKESVYHQIVELDYQSFNKLLHSGRLLIGLKSCPIRPHITILRCFKCQRLGHSSSICDSLAKKEKTTFGIHCAYCSKPHPSDSCQLKENESQHRCINCVRNNRNYNTNYNISHSSASNQCPSYIFFMREARSNFSNTSSTNSIRRTH